MNLESLIESVPEEIKFKGNSLAGFCLRYSTSSKVWTACYGYNKTKSHKFTGVGYSPIEAVLDFLSKKNK